MTELRVLPSPATCVAAPVVPVVPVDPKRVVVPITEVHARGGRFCRCRTCTMSRHPSYQLASASG